MPLLVSLFVRGFNVLGVLLLGLKLPLQSFDVLLFQSLNFFILLLQDWVFVLFQCLRWFLLRLRDILVDGKEG